MSRPSDIVFEPFRIDVASQRLMRGARPVPLTPKAFAVLSLLASRPESLVSKEEILRSIWAGTHVQDGILKVCIREIRRALDDPANAPRYIATQRRRGYRFVARIGAPGAAPAAAARPAGFVGRQAEMERLDGWLHAARGGERQVVFVIGEAGIGKSAAVQVFLERAGGDGLRVARGTCVEQYGAGEAYLPVLEALGRLCRGPGGATLVPLLRRHAPAWLAHMPALVAGADREALNLEVIGATSERMLREMAEAVEAMTQETPLVLVLEDLQWSDVSTLDLITSLARRREPARLFLVGTYRPAEVLSGHHPLRAIKQELRMRRQCHELPLECLAEEDVAAWLEMRIPGHSLARALAAAIHRRTDGSPLFMVNVVDYLVGRGLLGGDGRPAGLERVLEEVRTAIPDSLRQMIEKQFDRLTPGEQGVLEAASVAGLEFSAPAVAAGLVWDDPRAERACEGLSRRGQFLRATGAGRLPDGTITARFGFIHPLYQSVLYGRVPPARRLRLHQRIGERGITVYGTRAGEIAAELAVHFEQARDYRGAVDHLRRAAANAAGRSANREAIAHLTRAHDLAGRLPEPEGSDLQMAILEQVGAVRRSMGDMRGAAEDFEATVARARELGRHDREARDLFYLGSAVSWFDRARFRAAAARAGDLARHMEDGLLRSHVRGYAAYWNLLLRGWSAEDDAASAEATAVARRADDRALLAKHVSRFAYFRCLRADYRAGSDAAREGAALALEVGDGFDYLLGQYFLAWGLLHGGQWGETLRVLRDGVRMAERNGHHLWATLLRLEMAWLFAQCLHFEAAADLCVLALRRAEEERHPHGRLVARVLLDYAHLRMGRSGRGAPWPDAPGDPAERRESLMDWNWQLPLGLCLAECALAAGDAARARLEAEGVEALAAVSGERSYRALALRLKARIAAAEGDRARATAAIDAAIAAIEGSDAPMAEWQVRATAAAILRGDRVAEADRQRALAAAVVERLAASFAEEPDLGKRFVAAAAPDG